MSLDDQTITGEAAEAWVKQTQSPSAGVNQSSALQPGKLLGNRYAILSLLGRGGMGAVYKARDCELNRVVAIKIIHPEHADQPDVLLRFKQELILARQVTHKNVIRNFDLGEADGVKFISMEYIDGENLKAVLRRESKLSPEKATAVISQVCRALESPDSSCG